MRGHIIAILCVLLIYAGCTSAPDAEPEPSFESEPIRIAFVAHDPYTQSRQLDAAEALARDLGGTLFNRASATEFGNRFSIELFTVNDDPDNPDSSNRFREIASAHSLVVTIDGYVDLIGSMCWEMPETHFMYFGGFVRGADGAENVTAYTIYRTLGPFFGGMAAAATGVDRIAYLSPGDFDWLQGHAAAFFAGAIYIDLKFAEPESRIFGFADDWDEELIYQKATELYDDDIDLIFVQTWGENAGAYRAAFERKKLLIGSLQSDYWRFDYETGEITEGEDLGRNFVTATVLQTDVPVYTYVGEFIENGPPEERIRDSQVWPDLWDLFKTPFNEELVDAISAEFEVFITHHMQNRFILPQSADNMDSFIEEVMSYRKANPLSINWKRWNSKASSTVK